MCLKASRVLTQRLQGPREAQGPAEAAEKGKWTCVGEAPSLVSCFWAGPERQAPDLTYIQGPAGLLPRADTGGRLLPSPRLPSRAPRRTRGELSHASGAQCLLLPPGGTSTLPDSGGRGAYTPGSHRTATNRKDSSMATTPRAQQEATDPGALSPREKGL